MAERAIGDRNLLVVFTLGTFHAAVLIVALVLVLYAAGGLASLLSGLSTIAGLALFIALWATTVWSTNRTLRGAFTVAPRTSVPPDTLIARAAWRGGVNGIMFLACVGLILAISSAFNGDLAFGVIGAGFLVFATVGSAVAFVIGFVVGLLFACVDLALVSATRAILNNEKSRP
ncbi:MAG TPA: hypothetical protein VN895_05505 [Candidatus Acidoferrum sp.]|nr:hypothetical protein [Candidatus Acidoferrum sp.]